MNILETDTILSFASLFNETFYDGRGLLEMCSRFLLNLGFVWAIVHFFYYPKSHRRDYYFTFLLLSVSIFMLIYLMDGSKMEIGAALGLFAVFGIIRYRTESVPIREMTYLFFLVALSVLNGTTSKLSFVEHLAADFIFLATVWLCECVLLRQREGVKLVRYDNISLITPDKEEELKDDLRRRLGVEVTGVEVGAVDFLTDMAMLRVHYTARSKTANSVDNLIKLPQEDANK